MSQSYRGSCLCGAIRFEADSFRPRNGHCHCSMCRKFHGAAYATFVEIARDQFRWICGSELLRAYVADNGTTRRFCSNCGSSLTFAAANTDDSVVEIALACFDDTVPVTPDAHIFLAYGADWARPQDNLPKYAEGREGEAFAAWPPEDDTRKPR